MSAASHLRVKAAQRVAALALVSRGTDESVGNRTDQLSRHSEVANIDLLLRVKKIEGFVSAGSWDPHTYGEQRAYVSKQFQRQAFVLDHGGGGEHTERNGQKPTPVNDPTDTA